jgi:hypothetical protein
MCLTIYIVRHIKNDTFKVKSQGGDNQKNKVKKNEYTHIIFPNFYDIANTFFIQYSHIFYG